VQRFPCGDKVAKVTMTMSAHKEGAYTWIRYGTYARSGLILDEVVLRVVVEAGLSMPSGSVGL
jgi:hypothetical protein